MNRDGFALVLTVLVCVLAHTLFSCAPYNEPAPDHFRDQVDLDIFKIDGQDYAWSVQRERVEEFTGRKVTDLLTKYDWEDNALAVWWVDDQPCPYRPELNAIITCKDQDCPKSCYHGITYGCAEIYVATYRKDPSTICGTALTHEYGHCMRDLAGMGPDGKHKDFPFWDEMLPAVTREICDALKADEATLEHHLDLNAELAAGECAHHERSER